MSNLFLPKDQKPLDELITEKVFVVENKYDEVLLVGTENSLLAYRDLNTDPVTVMEGDYGFYDACVHNGTIYGANSNGDIFGIFSGTNVVQRTGVVYCLASVNGKLYDSNEVGVWESFTSKNVYDGNSNVMASYDGGLYAADYEGDIFDVFKKESIIGRDQRTRCLLEYGGSFWDGGEYGVYEGFGDLDPDVEDDIYCLFGFGGELFYVDENDLVKMCFNDGREFLLNGTEDIGVNFVKSVPKELMGSVLQ